MMKIKHLQKETIDFLAVDYLEIVRLRKLKNNEEFNIQKAMDFFYSTVIEKTVKSLFEIFPYLYRELNIESRLYNFDKIVLNDINFNNYRVEEFEEEYRHFKLNK